MGKPRLRAYVTCPKDRIKTVSLFAWHYATPPRDSIGGGQPRKRVKGWEPQGIIEESQNLELEGTWRSSYPTADEETKDQRSCHLPA